MTYEVTLILKEEKPEEVKKTIEEVHAKVLSLDFWQKRKLAYRIKKESYGSFFVCNLEIVPGDLQTLEKKLKLNLNILRYIILVKPKITARSKVEKIEKVEEESGFVKTSVDRSVEKTTEQPAEKIEKVEKKEVKEVEKPKVKKAVQKEEHVKPKKEINLENEEERLKALDEKLKKILEE